MIGELPKSLMVDGVDCPINSDYRAALTIFEAFGDSSLSDLNKNIALLEILYDFEIPENETEAQKQAIWFLDIGGAVQKETDLSPRTLDYRQDEQLIFSGINAVIGHDIREDDYMHWWTFYGLCQAISPESLISHIVGIRSKMGKGKKLEKYEQEFYRENKHLIDMLRS